MTRWAAAALLLLLPFTMAPRTSSVLNNGWEYSARDTGMSSQSSTTTFVIALSQGTGPASGNLGVQISVESSWRLVASSPGCAQVDVPGILEGVVCPVDFSSGRHVTVTVTVRAPKGEQAAFTPIGR
jgi:hypothetical protein